MKRAKRFKLSHKSQTDSRQTSSRLLQLIWASFSLPISPGGIKLSFFNGTFVNQLDIPVRNCKTLVGKANKELLKPKCLKAEPIRSQRYTFLYKEKSNQSFEAVALYKYGRLGIGCCQQMTRPAPSSCPSKGRRLE